MILEFLAKGKASLVSHLFYQSGVKYSSVVLVVAPLVSHHEGPGVLHLDLLSLVGSQFPK